MPWSFEADDRAAAEKILEGDITAVIPETSLISDGRVADKSDADADDAVDRQKGDDAQFHRHIVTIGLTLSTLRTPRTGHTLSKDPFLPIAQASAIVPPGHEALFASGPWAGWNYDFGVAAHVLTPRIKALVRHRPHRGRSGHGAPGRGGTEDEISLPELLDNPETRNMFGEHILYELQSLDAGRFHSNLSHNIARGLVDDSIRRFIVTVYAWWSTLRLVMVPFWNRMISPAEPSPEDPITDQT